MADPGVHIRVASLLQRPRDLPPAQAEDRYRAGEDLALGLDSALAAAGLKRTSLIAQRPNRVAFQETWTPPGGLAAFEARLAPEATGFPHLLRHAEAPWYYVPRDFPAPLWLPEPRPQTYTGPPPRTISVGSVLALARELDALELWLAAAGPAALTCFPAPLLEATAVSLETGLPIVVTSDE